MAPLDPIETQRYARQVLMEGWGEPAQHKLKRTTVFIAGAGGLGSPVSMYLAVAGVGHLRICDYDRPDPTNLNRQILHDESRLMLNKAVSAKMTLTALNPHIDVEALSDRIDADNVDRLVGASSIILDCMDNFETRYALNACAVRRGIPLVHASVWGMEGRLTFIQVPETPCLRCIYEEGPPKEVFPIVGAVPGAIGSLQALETLKYLTGIGRTHKNRLLVMDGGAMSFRTYKISPDPACPVCGPHRATSADRT
ncbi:MAG: Protein HesA, heterocyst [Candidatus Omnitrophica bacterium]|nr:Protein HesA, heterocyst [Candidatus Omnitrophota bacterium]